MNYMNMERLTFMLILLSSMTLSAHAQKEIGQNLFSHLQQDATILSENGLLEGDQKTKKFVSNFSSTHGRESTYKKNFSIEVNAILDYEIGEIQTNANSFPVMFLKRKDDPTGAKIEFLVIYQQGNAIDESAAIADKRNQWMELCNGHKANELVEKLYTADAYYYNRGRLLKGTKALSAEYAYMNSPGYSLKLTPKHVVFVTPDIAYEIGRCSGSYPYPYMLLWTRQNDGNWKVLMDSNY